MNKMFTYAHIYQEYHIRNNSPYQFFFKAPSEGPVHVLYQNSKL